METESRPHRVPIARALFRGVREAYDYLGIVMAISALVAVIALPLASGVIAADLAGQALGGDRPARSTRAPGGTTLFGLGAILTLLGPLLAGCFGLVRQIVAREDPGFADLFREARRRWRSGLAMGAVQSGVALVLIVDLVFFATLPIAGLRLVSVLFGYALIFWGLMALYQWPLLVDDEAGGGAPPRVRSVVRKSALLVLDNLPLSLALGLVALLFTIGCLLTGVGFVLLWAGTLAFLQTVALRELWRKYGLLAPEPDIIPEE
jgi:hypothetical protein